MERDDQLDVRTGVPSAAAISALGSMLEDQSEQQSAMGADVDRELAPLKRAAASIAEITARSDSIHVDLADRITALEQRATTTPREVVASYPLPALLLGTPKDVDVAWPGGPLPSTPVSVDVVSIECTLGRLTAVVKSWTSTKAVITVTAPLALSAGAAAVRVSALYVLSPA